MEALSIQFWIHQLEIQLQIQLQLHSLLQLSYQVLQKRDLPSSKHSTLCGKKQFKI